MSEKIIYKFLIPIMLGIFYLFLSLNGSNFILNVITKPTLISSSAKEVCIEGKIIIHEQINSFY